MLGTILAYAAVIAAMASFALCTWADYTVSGSVRRGMGG